MLRSNALRDTDALVGRLLTHVDLARDAVVVVGTAPNRADGRLAAVAVHAPGVAPGLLRSGTTQRTGFVQLMDVAPSVLDLVGMEVPDTMRGRPATVAHPSSDIAARERFLVDADRAAEFRDGILAPVADALIALVAALVVAVGLAGFRSRITTRAVAAWLALLVLVSSPPSTWLVPSRSTPSASVGTGDGSASPRSRSPPARVVGRHHPLDPVLMLLAVTVGVLGVDVVIGSPLQFNSALGFSPEVAGRFIGFGNAGYAAFGAAALFSRASLRCAGRAPVVASRSPSSRCDPPRRCADLGRRRGWGVIARPGFRTRRDAAHGVAAAVAHRPVGDGRDRRRARGAIAVDLSRPPGSRTHLGRLVEQLQREGPGEFFDVVSRKLGMNLMSWSTSPFRTLVPLVVIGFVLLWIAPGRPGAAAWRALDPTHALAIGFTTLVVLGYGLNDTGVLVPALMGAIGLAAVVPLAARRRCGRRRTAARRTAAR